MNLPHAPRHLTVSADTQSEHSTQLSGHWLVLVRVVWVVLVLLLLGLFVAILPVYYTLLETVCSDTTCVYGQLAPITVQSLHAFGLSIGNYATFNVAMTIVLELIACVVGGVLAWRKSNDWLVLLVALLLVMIGIMNTTYPLQLGHSAWHVPGLVLNFLGFGLLFLVGFLLPDGRFVSHWPRWLMLGWVGWSMALLFYPGLPFWQVLTLVIWFGEMGCVAVVLIYRYRRISSPVQQQQIKWVMFCGTISYVVAIGVNAPAQIFWLLGRHGSFYDLALISINAFIFLLTPLSFGIAILRYRLWDIDIIINRTLVYGVLTVSIVAFYILMVVGLGTLFQAQSNLGLSLLATGLIAVLFQPLHSRLQRAVNRLMYGERDDPYRVLSRLGRRLEATLVPDAVLPTIVETVAQALKLPYAAITLKQGQGFTVAASYGSPVERPHHLPLIYQTEQVGELILAPRSQGEVFSPADRRLFDDLARQAGVAAHAVRLTTDLQRSRERLVTAREEERRRLRRDLHDELGPTLAALNLQTGVVRNLITNDPVAADALVAEWRSELRAAIADIRRLVYELRPPALDELGLVGAIRDRAAQYSTHHNSSNIQVHVEAPDVLPPLPAAVEVAAYRIAQEALANVARHAQACRCSVRLWIDEVLHLEIADDGVGLPVDYYAGVGLIAMRERAEELGGTCVVKPRERGGTHVVARLPLM